MQKKQVLLLKVGDNNEIKYLIDGEGAYLEKLSKRLPSIASLCTWKI